MAQAGFASANRSKGAEKPNDLPGVNVTFDDVTLDLRRVAAGELSRDAVPGLECTQLSIAEVLRHD